MASGGDLRFSTNAAGVLSMLVCGQADARETQAAIVRLRREEPSRSTWFLYGIYYYAQAMQSEGEESSEIARRVLTRHLLPVQQRNGSWPAQGNEDSAGPIYPTSMAVMTLATTYHYKPIYQR